MLYYKNIQFQSIKKTLNDIAQIYQISFFMIFSENPFLIMNNFHYLL